MKSLLLYLLEVLFCSGLLLAFYRLLLVRKVSFRACRRYLVAAVFLSAVIPALDIPLDPARTVVYPLPLIGAPPAENLVQATGEVPAAGPAVTSGWRRISRTVAVGGYLTAVFLSLGFLAVRMVGIRRLRRRSHLTDCGAYTLAEHPQIATPFSFLHTVFLGGGYEGRRRMIVLCHEASHVRHRHSAERIAVELVRSLFWFNPFVWIAGRWLREVHEWEADRDVLDAGYGLTEYRTVIFHQLFGYSPDMACGLNHSLTKKRFAMMTQFKKRRFALARLGAALPVVASMMLFCSFTVRPAEVPVSSHSADRHVATVHIGPGGTIAFNGRPVTAGELERFIAAEREKLSEADRAKMVVVIQADKDTPVDDLADAMEASRRANALRLQFRTDASDPGVDRMLPPDLSRLPADGKVKVIVPRVGGFEGTYKIEERNLFLVHIDGSGAVMAGQAFREKSVSPEELPALIRAFILNADDDPAMSEKQVKEFDLPGGGVMNCPVSEGIVLLDTAPGASFGRYLEVQRLIAQSFGSIRNDVSQRQFGADYASLAEPERQVVARAVPLKLTEPRLYK